MNPLYSPEFLRGCWALPAAPAAVTRSAMAGLHVSPDVLISVGVGSIGRLFPAHRSVLRAHSGFFKAALTTSNDDVVLGEFEARASVLSSPPPQHVNVPHISVEVFAPLLSFMYSGWLEVTATSVYGILLAAQLLHMPHALELCRSFLQRQTAATCRSPDCDHLLLPRPFESTDSNAHIIKPIPSRRPAATAAAATLPMLGLGSWFPAWPWNSINPGGSGVTPLRSSPLPQVRGNVTPSPLRRSVTPEARKEVMEKKVGTPKSPERPIAISPDHDPASSPSNSSTKPSVTILKVKDPECSSVVIDVAACDGPVRFQRVLNPHYGQASNSTSSNTRKEKRCWPDENASPKRPHSSAGTDCDSPGASCSTNRMTDTYRCFYCNHTFKSHYCYQKHKRRHINPVPTDATQQSTNEKESSPSQSTAEPVLPEIKPLELNVQYFPCKTCGAKFPSYYFVHKHRRMCHDDNSETTGDTGDERTSDVV